MSEHGLQPASPGWVAYSRRRRQDLEPELRAYVAAGGSLVGFARDHHLGIKLVRRVALEAEPQIIPSHRPKIDPPERPLQARVVASSSPIIAGPSLRSLAARSGHIRHAASVTGSRMRPCLCCTRPFRSEGAHHRLCDPCRRSA